MEPLDGDTPPFWPQSTTINRYRRRQTLPSLFFNPVFLIVIVPIVFFLIIFLLLPPFLTFTSQIFKPSNQSVKKSWDSFNVFLVLFAVLCGIFAKRNDDGSDNGNGGGGDVDERNLHLMKSGRAVSNQWFDHRFSEREPERNDVDRFKRSGGSYPDLRQEPVQVNGGDDRFRFFDDFDINRYRRLEANVPVHRRRRSMGELSELKAAPVDKFVVSTSAVPPPVVIPAKTSVPAPSPVIPPTAPSSPVQKPRKTTYRTVSRKDKPEAVKGARSPPATSPFPPTPPPPPPPPAETIRRSEVEYVKVERKKSNTTTTTKEIKSVLASIYKQGKRKKKQKTKIIIDDSLLSQSTSPNPEIRSPAPVPPPPPPPPSLAVFNLFQKSSKSKKVHSVPPAPPPPPPSRSSLAQSMNRRNEISPGLVHSPPPVNYSRRHYNSTSIGRPPLPNRINSLNDVDENINSCGHSPLFPMPPPIPPFRMTAMKFTVKGDYVRVQSGPSTRCSSPELDDVVDQSSSSKEEESPNVVINGGDDDDDVVQQASSVFCPSPDVNMKADTFIARLRDEWKHDKINSLKGKQKLAQLH